jgi:hypothetical protein
MKCVLRIYDEAVHTKVLWINDDMIHMQNDVFNEE